MAPKRTGSKCSKPCKIRKVNSASEEEPRSHKPLLSSNLDLLSHGTFSDVTFIVGEKKERIPCHQLFLKARSPVFEVMFSERWNQDKKDVPLEDVDPETFKKFLKFIYSDFLDADVSEALELLQLAHRYDVQLLVSKCEKLLEYKVKFDDSFAVFQTARKYEKTQLMDKIGEMWAQSLSELQTLPIFTQLDKETLMFILKRNDLKMKEVDIFRLALHWAGHQTDATPEESLQDILPLIRFPTMTLNEFTTTVVPTKALPVPAVVELFTYFGTDDQGAKKSLAETLGFSTQERQPKSSIVYAALYAKDPIDIVNTPTTRQFQNLKESLQFLKRPQLHNDPPEPIQPIGLSAISFYCPLKASSTLESAKANPSFRAFKICLKSKYFRDIGFNLSSSHSYTELLSLPDVQLEEGKITDIKLGTVVPLKEFTFYCITVEEEPGDVGAQGYHEQKFDKDPLHSVPVNVGNIGTTLLSCHRNCLEGFEHDRSDQFHSQLIHRLGFEEL